MAEEQLKAFLEKLKDDTSLQDKLKAADDADAVVVIAKEAGFNIFAEDLSKAQSVVEDAELEGAAGGELTTGAPANGLQAWLYLTGVPEEAIIC